MGQLQPAVIPETPDRQGGHSSSTLVCIPAERNPGLHGRAGASGGLAEAWPRSNPGRRAPVPTMKAVPETVSHKTHRGE